MIEWSNDKPSIDETQKKLSPYIAGWKTLTKKVVLYWMWNV